MKKLAVAVLGLGLAIGAAGCGVDKDGTADNLIKSIEEAAGQDLTDDQKSCLTDLVKGFSDDDLKKLDETTADEALTTKFTDGAFECLADLGS